MSKKNKRNLQNFKPKEVILVYTNDSLAFILIRHSANFRVYMPKDSVACSSIAYLFELLKIDDLDIDICFTESGLQKLLDVLTPVDLPYEIPKHLGWYNLNGKFSTFAYEYSGFPLKLKVADGTELDVLLIWGLIMPQTSENESLIYLRSRITDSAGDYTYEIMPNFSINADEFGMLGAQVYRDSKNQNEITYNFRIPSCFARSMDIAFVDGYYFTKGNTLHFLSFLEYFEDIK